MTFNEETEKCEGELRSNWAGSSFKVEGLNEWTCGRHRKEGRHKILHGKNQVTLPTQLEVGIVRSGEPQVTLGFQSVVARDKNNAGVTDSGNDAHFSLKCVESETLIRGRSGKV